MGVDVALNIYGFVEWTHGGCTTALIEYEEAFAKFVKNKTEGNCQDVCSEAAEFIQGVPSAGMDVIGGFFLRDCTLRCCDLPES